MVSRREKILQTAGKVVPIALGLTVMIWGWIYLNNYLDNHKEMVSIPVAAHVIQPYTTISADDIEFKEVIAGSEQPTAIRDPKEAIGKFSTASIQKGWQINKLTLTTTDEFENKRQIGINIDAARSAGVKPGDLVDVYFLNQGNWDTGTKASKLIAENVKILAVCNQQGQSLMDKQATQGKLVRESKEPRVIYMLVKPEDVQKIIGGSAPKNNSIALAKKRKEDNDASKIANASEQLNQQEQPASRSTNNNGKTFEN